MKTKKNEPITKFKKVKKLKILFTSKQLGFS